jgi:hypothetical protein
MARSDTTTERVEFGSRTSMYPYAALRCPTYRENSHANHTWHQNPQETACFIVPAVPSPWVRFPSPAPLPFKHVLTHFSTNNEGFPVDAHDGAGDI